MYILGSFIFVNYFLFLFILYLYCSFSLCCTEFMIGEKFYSIWFATQTTFPLCILYFYMNSHFRTHTRTHLLHSYSSQTSTSSHFLINTYSSSLSPPLTQLSPLSPILLTPSTPHPHCSPSTSTLTHSHNNKWPTDSTQQTVLSGLLFLVYCLSQFHVCWCGTEMDNARHSEAAIYKVHVKQIDLFPPHPPVCCCLLCSPSCGSLRNYTSFTLAWRNCTSVLHLLI